MSMSTAAPEHKLAQIVEQFNSHLIIESPPLDDTTIESPPSHDETKSPKSPPSAEETVDEDFSFSSAQFDSMSAEDLFADGQIRPVFPFFDQTILTAADHTAAEDNLVLRPPMKKVLVESPTGEYREFSGKSLPETCDKSNSTGFSKMWRFREMEQRSNSDGRDTFVFLKRESERRERETVEGHKGNITSGNRKGKGKTTSSSAHEIHYVENRNKREKDRMRSYLPYRPGLFGFFTNVRGGLTKNVHPY